MKRLAAATAVSLLALAIAAPTASQASGAATVAYVTASDLPTGSLTWGVSDYSGGFNASSGSGNGSASLGGADAGGAWEPPYLSVDGSIGVAAETELDASALYRINFYINGPVGGEAPIVITGSATGSASGAGIVSAGASISEFNDYGQSASIYSFIRCTDSTSCGGDFQKTYTLPTGVIFTVTLSVGGGFTYNPTSTTSGPGAFSASIDPPDLITIDPSFLSGNPSYSLAVTGAPAPPAPVPEPATWASLLLGSAMLGASLRRRRLQPRLA